MSAIGCSFMKFEKSTFLAASLMLALSALGQTTANLASSVSDSEQVKTGVVIESVQAGFEAAKSGMQPGDVLLAWSRGSEGGAINSPFDLAQIEIEQSPHGTVTIQGRRGAQGRTWTLGLDEWKLKARPDLSPDLLALYNAVQQSGKSGKLQQGVESWRAVVARARQYQTAWLSSWLLYQAAEMMSERKAWLQADSFYQQAVGQAREAPPEVRAYLLDGWCYSFMRRNDWADAEKHCREAIDESRESGPDTLLTAAHLFLLGRVLEAKGDFNHALEQYRQVLAIREKLAPDSAAMAAALFRLGHASWMKGDLGVAEGQFRSALVIQQKLIPGTISEALTLTLIAQLRGDTGDLVQAEQYGRDAVAIEARLAPGSLELAQTLAMLGIVLTNKGDLIQADELYRRSLSIYEKLEPQGLGAGVDLSLIGQLEWARGDLAASERDFLRAAAILREVAPETQYYSYSLLGLGILCDLKGDSAKAESYLRQVLAIQMKNAPSHLFTADALSRLGNVLKERGDFTAAEDLYLQALAIQNDQAPLSPRTAQTFDALCDLADRRGNLDKAEEYCRKELSIVQQLTPGTAPHAYALGALASILRRKHQLDAAARLYEETLIALESQMARLGGSRETQAGFRADHSGYYFEYADLLVNQRRFSEAFQVLERARARALLEMLATAHADINKGVDPILLKKERSLQIDINAKSDLRIRLLTDKHTDEQIKAIDKQINDLLSQYQDVEGQIRASSPGYAALTQPQPLGVDQIQSLLDKNTLLLEYSLGEERSYVFAVTADSLSAFELPKRAEIDKAARNLYELLTARNHVSSKDRLDRGPGPEADYPSAAARLGQMILGPVAAELKGKRLLVVADGALQYIPFAILPEPDSHTSTAPSALPLVLNHEIANLPSASVLGILRQEQTGRKPAPRTVAVLADPVFDKHDPRISAARVPEKDSLPVVRGAGNSAPAGLPGDLLTRSARDLGLNRDGKLTLPRLLFTRREAAAIMAATPKGKGMEALDFSATRARAMSPKLSQFRMIHFATHGLLNSEHPELSGLVFSLVDKNGRPQDGFLQLQDIYNLNLPADLVVLSACETALGKEINGEGLIGLTRGFMYAGASRVVASLWKVSDAATARLMANFYSAMEKDGLAPAAALRAAQIAMWKQKRWRSPYYWAAFQIQGEYR